MTLMTVMSFVVTLVIMDDLIAGIPLHTLSKYHSHYHNLVISKMAKSCRAQGNDLKSIVMTSTSDVAVEIYRLSMQ
jgi:hypothetical protein